MLQRDDDRRQHREQPDDEPGRAGCRGVHAPEQQRLQAAHDVARERPPEHHERDHDEDLERGLARGAGSEREQLIAVVPQQDHPGKERREHQQLRPRAADRPGREAQRQPELAPSLGARRRCAWLLVARL